MRLNATQNLWGLSQRQTSSVPGGESCWAARATEPDQQNEQMDREILHTCLPSLKSEEADKLVEMLATDFLHLLQLMEFGAAGLFGGGIPKDPFRE